MNNYDFILERRSIRKYKKGIIPEKDIKIILEAANHSPMAIDYKTWKLILVKDNSLIERIAELSANQVWIKNASILLIGVMMGNADKKWKIVDTSIVLENVVLTAEALGYGSCWIGAFDEYKLKKVLKVPKQHNILAYIAIGIKKGQPKARKYKSLNEIIFIDSYGDRFN